VDSKLALHGDLVEAVGNGGKMPSAAGKEFLQPSSPQEVVELLVKYGERALVVGGGTFLHGLLARGVLREMDVFIDLQKVGLSYVKYERDTLAIGATTTFAELSASNHVQNRPELGAVLDALGYPPRFATWRPSGDASPVPRLCSTCRLHLWPSRAQ
jgi:xanthine dehydrogenase iron-sulfur cluster and FAD-binding subunit A